MVEYAYIHDRDRSRDYEKLGNVIDDGAAKVRREAMRFTYHVAVAGNEFGEARSFRDAKARAQELRRNLGTGKNVLLGVKENGTGGAIDVVKFVEFKPVAEVPDGPGVEGVDRFMECVRTTFPNARYAGACVCKPDSDHADCAAVDYFDTYDAMDNMRRAALNRADYFHTKYVILRDRIYFADGSSRYYSGVYHTHIHFSCYGGIQNAAC